MFQTHFNTGWYNVYKILYQWRCRMRSVYLCLKSDPQDMLLFPPSTFSLIVRHIFRFKYRHFWFFVFSFRAYKARISLPPSCTPFTFCIYRLILNIIQIWQVSLEISNNISYNISCQFSSNWKNSAYANEFLIL